MTALRIRFGRVVRRRRQASGMTQEQLADRAALHRNHIGLLERGEVAVVLDTVERLAAALDVPLGILFAEVEAETAAEGPADAPGEREGDAES